MAISTGRVSELVGGLILPSVRDRKQNEGQISECRASDRALILS